MPESQSDRVQRDSGSGLPEPHENAVLVFMLTPLALVDLGFRAFASLATATRFPMLPVPPQRGGFDFRALDRELTELGKLNAVAWDDGDPAGETVISAIRRYLGLEPFSRDCRLFISYRRSDGMAAAHAIYRHFRGIGFDAFLDTEDEAIEPGEPFQPRIHEAIPEKDFLLLVDSPDAADSGWVREEVSVALANRVSILVVRVAGSQGFPQVRDLPAFDWGTDPRRGLLDLERAVRSQLAARRTFDRRVQQILGHLGPLVPLTTSAIRRRRLLVTLGDGADTRRCLLDYEDASYDLIRLHRLALGRTATGLTGPSDRALLVHRGRGLSSEERTAVDWAIHGEPLQVLSLDELAPFFLSAGPAT
jgi:DNA-binding SARP family transcriptional activator